MTTNIPLMKRAVVLFPRADYTNPSSVRHARRAWLRCVDHLRNHSNKGWVVDNHVPRQPDAA